MFTGIIEELGTLQKIEKENTNYHLTMRADMTKELKIDQSLAHNGCCLTVIAIDGDTYKVTAIDESMKKTNLHTLKEGDKVNLERGMQLGARLDGHIVQGHVDQTATCKSVVNEDGSWRYTFSYDSALSNVTIEKGSITVNGVSLTVVDSKENEFSVAIIPYTYENTVFHTFQPGTVVNLEFDVIGKYVKRLMNQK